jgi:hypothetical protein
MIELNNSTFVFSITILQGQNSLSAESWLKGDNCLSRLHMWGGAAWLSDLIASLALLPE